MERRISGVSYMCWMDSHNAILCCGFLCTLLISFYFTANTPRAITPRATTPHPYNRGLSRLCIHPGYHTRAITLNHTRTSGYHTRHSSSYFVVFISPAIAPPFLHHLHHHQAPHVPTYSTRQVANRRCIMTCHEYSSLILFVSIRWSRFPLD